MTRKGSSDRNRRPALEWIVGFASALVVSAFVAFLAYEALFGDTRPPDLVATIDRLERLESGTLVVIALANRGGHAAADITVEATVNVNGTGSARKEIRFDYVASHAVRRGAFVLEEPAVAAQDVRLGVHGYVQP